MLAGDSRLTGGWRVVAAAPAAPAALVQGRVHGYSTATGWGAGTLVTGAAEALLLIDPGRPPRRAGHWTSGETPMPAAKLIEIESLRSRPDETRSATRWDSSGDARPGGDSGASRTRPGTSATRSSGASYLSP